MTNLRLSLSSLEGGEDEVSGRFKFKIPVPSVKEGDSTQPGGFISSSCGSFGTQSKTDKDTKETTQKLPASFGVRAPLTEPPSKKRAAREEEPVAPKTEVKQSPFQFGGAAAQQGAPFGGTEKAGGASSKSSFVFGAGNAIPPPLSASDNVPSSKNKKRGMEDDDVTFPMKLATPSGDAKQKTNTPAFSFGASSDNKPPFALYSASSAAGASFAAPAPSVTFPGGSAAFGSTTGSQAATSALFLL